MCPEVFTLWGSVWGCGGLFLSMLGQGRSSGFFFSGFSSMRQCPRVYLRILPEINSVARTSYPVSI